MAKVSIGPVGSPLSQICRHRKKSCTGIISWLLWVQIAVILVLTGFMFTHLSDWTPSNHNFTPAIATTALLTEVLQSPITSQTLKRAQALGIELPSVRASLDMERRRLAENPTHATLKSAWDSLALRTRDILHSAQGGRDEEPDNGGEFVLVMPVDHESVTSVHHWLCSVADLPKVLQFTIFVVHDVSVGHALAGVRQSEGPYPFSGSNLHIVYLPVTDTLGLDIEMNFKDDRDSTELTKGGKSGPQVINRQVAEDEDEFKKMVKHMSAKAQREFLLSQVQIFLLLNNVPMLTISPDSVWSRDPLPSVRAYANAHRDWDLIVGQSGSDGEFMAGFCLLRAKERTIRLVTSVLEQQSADMISSDRTMIATSASTLLRLGCVNPVHQVKFGYFPLSVAVSGRWYGMGRFSYSASERLPVAPSVIQFGLVWGEKPILTRVKSGLPLKRAVNLLSPKEPSVVGRSPGLETTTLDPDQSMLDQAKRRGHWMLIEGKNDQRTQGSKITTDLFYLPLDRCDTPRLDTIRHLDKPSQPPRGSIVRVQMMTENWISPNYDKPPVRNRYDPPKIGSRRRHFVLKDCPVPCLVFPYWTLPNVKPDEPLPDAFWWAASHTENVNAIEAEKAKKKWWQKTVVGTDENFDGAWVGNAWAQRGFDASWTGKERITWDLFELEMSYRRSADVHISFLAESTGGDIDRLFEPPVNYYEKIPAVVFLQRNCQAQPRTDFMKTFMGMETGDDSGENLDANDAMRFLVHSYGECLNTIGNKPNLKFHNFNDRNMVKNKMDLFRTYRYCIALENSDGEDYVTEKVWDALMAGCVPIVAGPLQNFETMLPDLDSVIYIGELRAIEEAPDRQGAIEEMVSGLVAQLNELEENPDRYAQKLAWKTKPWRELRQPFRDYVEKKMNRGVWSSMCTLCEKLDAMRP
eukprot:Clim_evm11s170 gene=Clim_evmTU11s170